MIKLKQTDSPFIQMDDVLCAHERALILLDAATDAILDAKHGREPGEGQDRAFSDAACLLMVAHEYLTAIGEALDQIHKSIGIGR
ncbi:hypothetical protein CVO77_03590 [Sphingopyxis lindanitolerans]|uniref:DUF3077 domain-containing protein n=1 Tax=Sphingopyxis lindanitolerans TaxID=2054227 RepID=A0A2S8B5S0_9SPHN|nr:hypothetical protein [Sphingopyxis lindanitolerans]PQM27666.1 hypothetical protein CVO77_03590 [Sphingopyxis lindanitolerans]